MAHVVEVRGPDGGYFIRAEPWNYTTSGLAPLAPLQRLVERNHSWVIRVRAYHEDPFGSVLHEERVRTRREVRDAIKRLERAIHAGTLER